MLKKLNCELYTYVDDADIDEIVESHLQNGQVVQRLVTPAELGR